MPGVCIEGQHLEGEVARHVVALRCAMCVEECVFVIGSVVRVLVVQHECARYRGICRINSDVVVPHRVSSHSFDRRDVLQEVHATVIRDGNRNWVVQKLQPRLTTTQWHRGVCVCVMCEGRERNG